MGRRIFLFCALLAAAFGALPCAAQDTAAKWLQRLREAVARQGDYAVGFSIETSEGYADRGRYCVSGESYYLTLGDAEVFCDGKVRYEVNKTNREVTIAATDAGGRSLLDDPTHAFDFLGEVYASELVSAAGGRVVVRLTPREAGAVTEVLLTLDAERALPERVVYGADELRVSIGIGSFGPLAEPLPRFDAAAWEGYEFIDFR